MPYVLLIILIVGCPCQVLAQPGTGNTATPQTNTSKAEKQTEQSTSSQILPHRSPVIGGYGSLMLSASPFNGKMLPIVAFRGALILNNRIGCGVEFQSIVPTQDYEILMPPEPKRSLPAKLTGSAAGIYVEPIVFPSKLLHLTVPIAVGGGMLKYTRSWTQEDGWDYAGLIDQDFFWYIHPGIQAEFNLSSIVRTGIGISYRIAGNLTLMGTSTEAFNGISALFFIKIGVF